MKDESDITLFAAAVADLYRDLILRSNSKPTALKASYTTAFVLHKRKCQLQERVAAASCRSDRGCP